MAYVYRHIRLDKNQPFYIGIGSDNNYQRADTHKNRNIYWRRIINKTLYEVEILLDGLTWEQACEKEKEFIKLYGRVDNKTGILCNLTDGGEGTIGCIASEETRKKLSKKNKGNKYRVGKKLSLEHKEIISNSNKDRIWGDKSKEKLSNIFKGKKIWDTRVHPFLNKKLSESHKEKLKIANPKIYAKGGDNYKAVKINQYTLTNEFIKTWNSSKCIERELNIDCSSVIKCCKGKLKTTKGYIFKYANSTTKSTY